LILSQKEKDPAAFRNYIAESIMKLKPDDHKRNEIKIDYFVLIYKFCSDRQFSMEQRSTLLSIGIYIYLESLEKKYPSIESYEMLVDILKKHVIQREPYSIKMFSEQDKTEILKLFRDSFYKHYSMYEIAGTKFIDYTLTTAHKFEHKYPELMSLNDGEVVSPESVPVISKLYLKLNVAEDPSDVKEIRDGVTLTTEGDIKGPKNLDTERNELDVSMHSPRQEIKTEEEIKLEKELEGTLKSFYDKFDKSMKVQDEKIGKLLPNQVVKTSGPAGKTGKK